MSMVTTFRIVETDEAASLNPRAIWNHWRTFVIWDHRTYYGILEFIGVFVILNSVLFRLPKRLGSGVFILLTICPLHYYGNHRNSAHFLTRAGSQLSILSILTLAVLISQLLIFPIFWLHKCYNCETPNVVDGFLWLSIPILLFTMYIIISAARNPRRDPILAELPSPVDLDEDPRPAWTMANVADGIEDDSLEPEGQLRL